LVFLLLQIPPFRLHFLSDGAFHSITQHHIRCQAKPKNKKSIRLNLVNVRSAYPNVVCLLNPNLYFSFILASCFLHSSKPQTALLPDPTMPMPGLRSLKGIGRRKSATPGLDDSRTSPTTTSSGSTFRVIPRQEIVRKSIGSSIEKPLPAVIDYSRTWSEEDSNSSNRYDGHFKSLFCTQC
jgi:hypothetical protein